MKHEERQFELSGIVNVGMYNTILAPEYAIAEDDTDEAAWEGFDNDQYKNKVLELAVKELKLLLGKVPATRNIAYVEGSAFISSPEFYNERNDQLRFRVTADAGQLDEEGLQRYIETCLNEELNAEFDAQYHIYQVLKENYSIADFNKTTIQGEKFETL